MSVANIYPAMVEKTTLNDNLAFVNVKKTLDLVNSTMNFKKV